jgi:ApaG protein
VSDTTTRGIRVEVHSAYLPERSSPEAHHYFFAYRVRISNNGQETVKLVSREWNITDAHGRLETVKGPGVVGQQPALAPGQAFEYTSFCPLTTPMGVMQGSYQMRSADGTSFDAVIAPFSLAVPHALN